MAAGHAADTGGGAADVSDDAAMVMANDSETNLYATICPSGGTSPIEIACNGKVTKLDTTGRESDDVKRVADHMASAGHITVGVCIMGSGLNRFAHDLCSATIKAVVLNRVCWACRWSQGRGAIAAAE